MLDDKVTAEEVSQEGETRDFPQRSPLAKRGRHSKSVNSLAGVSSIASMLIEILSQFKFGKLHSTCRPNFDSMWVGSYKLRSLQAIGFAQISSVKVHGGPEGT